MRGGGAGVNTSKEGGAGYTVRGGTLYTKEGEFRGMRHAAVMSCHDEYDDLPMEMVQLTMMTMPIVSLPLFVLKA